MASAADKLVARMESAARVSADEARQIAEQMCADGIRSAPEAEALVEYNTRLDGHDAEWSALFQRALRDYVLLRTVPEGSVSDDNLLWLRDTLAPEGHVRNTGELDFLILLQRQADSVPQDYDRFVLKAVCRQILREGSASAANTARVRKVLSASRRTGGEWISRDEARRLWKTNTELGKAANDPAWNALFARSIGNYLYACTCPHPRAAGEALSREAWLDAADDVPGCLTAGLDASFTEASWFESISRSAVTAREARQAAAEAAAAHGDHPGSMKTWLRRRLGWDNAANPAERALVDFLNREAPGLTAGLTIAAG